MGNGGSKRAREDEASGDVGTKHWGKCYVRMQDIGDSRIDRIQWYEFSHLFSFLLKTRSNLSYISILKTLIHMSHSFSYCSCTQAHLQVIQSQKLHRLNHLPSYFQLRFSLGSLVVERFFFLSRIASSYLSHIWRVLHRPLCWIIFCITELGWELPWLSMTWQKVCLRCLPLSCSFFWYLSCEFVWNGSCVCIWMWCACVWMYSKR